MCIPPSYAERLCPGLCWSAVVPPKRGRLVPAGPLGFVTRTLPSDPSPPPRHAVGRRAISLVSLLPFSLTGTEKARKPGRRRKVPQRLRSRARAAAASAPPPGAARPPASQRPSAQLARDGGVSDPARPCPALPPRALTASPCSTGLKPGAGGRERRGGAARDALFLPEPGQLPSSPRGSGRSRARGSPSRWASHAVRWCCPVPASRTTAHSAAPPAGPPPPLPPS